MIKTKKHILKKVLKTVKGRERSRGAEGRGALPPHTKHHLLQV